MSPVLTPITPTRQLAGRSTCYPPRRIRAERCSGDRPAQQADAVSVPLVALKGSGSAASVAVVSSRGWMLFAAMSIIWGIPYLFINIAVEGVSVPVLARTGVGAAVLPKTPLELR